MQWDVEVKGEGANQTFDFGQSANIFFDLNSDNPDLVDRTGSISVMKDVTAMIVTLR